MSENEKAMSMLDDIERHMDVQQDAFRKLQADLSAAVRERDEARASATEANITLTASRQLYREARAEVERLREDAKRYRWLRANNFQEPTPKGFMTTLEEIDAAIDAARRAG